MSFFNEASMEEVKNFSDYIVDTNATEVSTPYEERPETYIVPVVFALIFLVGVLGNGALIVIFLRHRNMRNVPNTYIFSLAVGDLLVIVASVPFTSTVYTIPTYPFSELICKVSESVKDISIGVSVFTLTALSADRFFAIVDPMRTLHSGGSRATKFTVITAISIWIFALICAIPTMIFTHLQDIPVVNPQFVACYPFPFDWEIYPKVNVITKFFVYYAIPLFIIGFFYVMMARHLIHSTHNIPGEMHGQVRQIRARRKVAKLVLAFVVIFAFCFFPHHVFMIWFHTNPNMNTDYNAFWHTFRIIAFCLSFINSCINPIALYCVSGAFRKHFNRYLLCCWFRDQDTNGNGRGGPLSMNVSNRAASRRFNSKSTWDSTSMAQFQTHSVRRNPQQLLMQHREDVTVCTTAMNGIGGTLDVDGKKKAERIAAYN